MARVLTFIRRLAYRDFRFLSSMNYRARRRFTKAGGLVAVAFIASAFLGLDTNRSAAYQVFTFLFVLMVVSIASCRFYRPHFSVRRILPRFATAGRPFTYRAVVRNYGPGTHDGLSLLETLADPRPSRREFLTTSDPDERHRRWIDRAIGYSRWRSLVARNTMAVIREQSLPRLASGGECEVRAELVPLRRGRLRLLEATVARLDPFGLFKAFATIDMPESVVVLPKRYPLPAIQWPGTGRYHQGRVALAASVGDSEEFLSVREFRPGDPRRRLHWKSWAKIGTPIVKEFQAEFFVRHALILDTFQNGATDAFEEAVSVAASFVGTAHMQESLLDVIFVGSETHCVTAGRGLGQTEHLLEILACITPSADQPFTALQTAVIQRRSLLSGCICILLAWDQQRQDLVARLQTFGVPTLVFVVTDGVDPDPLPLGPMARTPEQFRHLRVGNIAEGLAV